MSFSSYEPMTQKFTLGPTFSVAISSLATYGVIFFQQKFEHSDLYQVFKLISCILFFECACHILMNGPRVKVSHIRQSLILNSYHPQLLQNAVLLLAKYLLRWQIICHFQPFFGFLMESIAFLLVLPLRQQIKANGWSINCFTLALGYLVVAGVNTKEYGLLIHAVCYIVLGCVISVLDLSNTTSSTHFQTNSLATLLFAMIISCLASVACGYLSYVGVIGTATKHISPDFKSFEWALYAVAISFCNIFKQENVGPVNAHMNAQQNITILGNRDSMPYKYLSSWNARSLYVTTGLSYSIVHSIFEYQWLLCVANIVVAIPLVVPELSNREDYGGKDKVIYKVDTNPNISANGFAMRRWLPVFQDLWSNPSSRKIILFLAVNISYMFVEIIVGLWTNSLSLIGDAGHMLFDNSALIIGLVASYIGRFPPDTRFTYGYGRVEVLSGFLNSILLLVIAFQLLVESFSRILEPPKVSTENLLLTSIVGLIVNLIGLVWFHDLAHEHGHGHHHDHTHAHHGHSHGLHKHEHSHKHANINQYDSHGHSHKRLHVHHEHSHKQHSHQGCNDDHFNGCGSSNSNMLGVYLHVLADTLGSVGVIVSSMLIEWKGWYISDPLSSAAISIMIVGSTLPLLKDTCLQLLQRVPPDLERFIDRALLEIQGITGLVKVDRWHVWRHAADVCVCTLHVIIDSNYDDQVITNIIKGILEQGITGKNSFISVEVVKVNVVGNVHTNHKMYATTDNSSPIPVAIDLASIVQNSKSQSIWVDDNQHVDANHRLLIDRRPNKSNCNQHSSKS